MKGKTCNEATFYAVSSSRGLGVYSDYSKLEKDKSYIGDNPNIEVYRSRKEAEIAAIKNYNSSIARTHHRKWSYHELPRISWFYFTSKIDSGTALCY